LPATPSFAGKKNISPIQIAGPWTLSFPPGWGAPDSLQLPVLKTWKDLDLSPEGKAFSGTATYTTTFNVSDATTGKEYILDLGNVDMVAAVTLNGEQVGSILAPPYRIQLKNLVKQGQNTISVQVTSTWFNRLVFDAGQPEEKRKTWTIDGPDKTASLRVSGLMGPVMIEVSNIK
jgi:beta-galactosidase/beta-glucuronidase